MTESLSPVTRTQILAQNAVCCIGSSVRRARLQRAEEGHRTDLASFQARDRPSDNDADVKPEGTVWDNRDKQEDYPVQRPRGPWRQYR